MAKKKLQIFISSTYTDLQEERQAAVEAILGSKHIPAGMELFKAGNKSQLVTIKKWINESDVYMLILGGRYGSIEPDSGKSYTHLEYEYALKQGIPVFAVILSDVFLHKKAAEMKCNVFENENREKYDKFKEFVMTKVIKEVGDCKDIQIAIKDSITEIEDENDLIGWVRGDSVKTNEEAVNKISELELENLKLKNKIEELNKSNKTNKTHKNCTEEDIESLEQKIKFEVNVTKDIGMDSFIKTINISLKDTFKLLAPGVISYRQTRNARKYFEAVLKEVYSPEVYTFNIRIVDFENVKVKMIALGLLELSEEGLGTEHIKLTSKGNELILKLS